MVDVSKYKELFIDESKEHLQSISRNLLTLEKEPENIEALNETFRSVHTLKSMAATMGSWKNYRMRWRTCLTC